MDLGIALGVAAEMASEFNIDNRLMYTARDTAMTLGFLEADMIVALPLSISAKNIFFDRGQIKLSLVAGYDREFKNW